MLFLDEQKDKVKSYLMYDEELDVLFIMNRAKGRYGETNINFETDKSLPSKTSGILFSKLIGFIYSNSIVTMGEI